MPYGYLGTHPNQQKANSGVFTIADYVNTQDDKELGGSLELIAQSDHSSNVAVIDFTSIQESKYDVHCLYISTFSYNIILIININWCNIHQWSYPIPLLPLIWCSTISSSKISTSR